MAIILQVEDIVEDKTAIMQAANAIKSGKTVIFPTETVYGLGANALDEKAAEKIYRAKGRPSDNPLIVHISDLDMLEELVEDVNDQAKKLMELFWPGPLTIVLNKSEKIPYSVTGGLDTVGIRMPSDKIARALIKEAGVPVAAPSANLSGKPSITDVEHALREMSDRVDMILISESSEIGLESTVIDATGEELVILRPGKIGKNTLKKYFKNVKIDKGLTSKEVAPKSPGMKYTHYSPNAKVYISEDIRKIRSMEENFYNDGKKVRVLCEEDYVEVFREGLSLGKNIEEIARNLFTALRQADDDKIEIIICQYFHGGDLADAVMNRLLKAGELI